MHKTHLTAFFLCFCRSFIDRESEKREQTNRWRDGLYSCCVSQRLVFTRHHFFTSFLSAVVTKFFYCCWKTVKEFFTYPKKICWTVHRICWNLLNVCFAASFWNHTHTLQFWIFRFWWCFTIDELFLSFSLFLFVSGFFLLFCLEKNSMLYIWYDRLNKIIVCLKFLLMVKQLILIFRIQMEVIYIELTRISLQIKNKQDSAAFFCSSQITIKVFGFRFLLFRMFFLGPFFG